MALAHKGPLALPPFRVDGKVESAVNSGVDVFALSAYDWAGRPLRSADGELAPACWTIENAFLTWTDFYADFAEYAADSGVVFVDPSPRWGEAGSLVRRPRAVIVLPGFFVLGSSPGRLACEALEEQLLDARVFCGRRRGGVTGSHSIVRSCLLEKEFLIIVDGSADDYLVLDVDEEQSAGGEVLFIVEDYSQSDVSVSAYYDQSGGGAALPLVRAHDLDLLSRCGPKFARVKYLLLQAAGELVTAAAKDAIESFIDDAEVEVDYLSVTGNIHNGAGLATAQAAAESAIEEFFGL